MTKKIEDAQGGVLGWLETPNPNEMSLYAKNGQKLGTWFKDSDTTYDQNGKVVGHGNVLAMLLIGK